MNTKHIEQQLQELKRHEYLIGVRLELTRAGGTASKAAKTTYSYGRLRAGKNKILPNGKKSQYIRLAKIPTIRAAIDRGKQITYLETQLKTLQNPTP